ncbi:unnamed protein product [Clavelina lepadiformis]|uniref:Uncharacterized protein n=1 Tax=Clavelina lepadiformis TaxID=159417 RepID=A0ABP0FTN5_CLALP
MGTKPFFLARVDNAKDVFQELWGQKNIDHIMEYTIAEARRQRDSKFSSRNEELQAFSGQGVLKGRLEPLTNFWDLEYVRSIFRKLWLGTNFNQLFNTYVLIGAYNSKCSDRELPKVLFLHIHVTIDEQLFPCRSLALDRKLLKNTTIVDTECFFLMSSLDKNTPLNTSCFEKKFRLSC